MPASQRGVQVVGAIPDPVSVTLVHVLSKCFGFPCQLLFRKMLGFSLYAISPKVAGLILDTVIGFLSWPNNADNLTAIYEPIV
jgi:hypothetical protein